MTRCRGFPFPFPSSCGWGASFSKSFVLGFSPVRGPEPEMEMFNHEAQFVVCGNCGLAKGMRPFFYVRFSAD